MKTLGLGFGFREKMSGTWEGTAQELAGTGKFRFDFDVRCPRAATTPFLIEGRATGRVTMEGVADDAPAEGTLEISPVWRRRIRYAFTFTSKDGRRLRFDGSKRIGARHFLRSWTTLPGHVYDAESGAALADVIARFDLRRLPALLRSFRPAVAAG